MLKNQEILEILKPQEDCIISVVQYVPKGKGGRRGMTECYKRYVCWNKKLYGILSGMEKYFGVKSFTLIKKEQIEYFREKFFREIELDVIRQRIGIYKLDEKDTRILIYFKIF